MSTKLTRRTFLLCALAIASCSRPPRGLKAEMVRAQQADSRRLMIVLHGLGDSAAGYEWLPAAMNLPWLNYLLVNAPHPYEGGYSWFNSQNDIKSSRELLGTFLDEKRSAGWPTEQTMLFGYSQGCNLAWQLGLHYPHRFAGIVGINGFVNDLPAASVSLSPISRQQRYLVTHGTEDPVIPLAPSAEQVQQLKKAGLNIDWREFKRAHTIAGIEEIDVIREFTVGSYPKD
jgi:phospholipase/carboxylesterase